MKSAVSAIETMIGIGIALFGASWIRSADRAAGHLEARGIMHAAGVFLLGLGIAIAIAGFHSWRRPARFWVVQLLWIGGYHVLLAAAWLLWIGR